MAEGVTLREVIVDTETTGLDPAEHRLVELAAIELVNHLPTGRRFQRYLNPERAVLEESFRIHGLSDAFLADKAKFAQVVDEFLAFIGDATLVAHNADFDIGFINAELARLKLPSIDRARALDTVTLARRKFPGQPASLDALCQRFAIDNTMRTLHGALLDAELLADVYIELLGGRQSTMLLVAASSAPDQAAITLRPMRQPRPHAPLPEEVLAHQELLKSLKQPLWLA
jgi:DNA polymerase-3 subunit epsilon